MKEKSLRIFKKFPVLKTERLLLRRITKDDVYDVFDYSSSENLTKYLLWYPHKTITYTSKYLSVVNKLYKKVKFYDWGIEFEGRMIGTVGFTRLDLNNAIGEIGYVISEKYAGCGIATEAAKRIIEFGFNELSLNRIEARYIKENLGSKRVASKAGMREEAVIRSGIKLKGEYKDLVISSVLKDEYINKK